MENQATPFAPPANNNVVGSTSSAGGQRLSVSNPAFRTLGSEGNPRQPNRPADIGALLQAKQPEKECKVPKPSPGPVTQPGSLIFGSKTRARAITPLAITPLVITPLARVLEARARGREYIASQSLGRAIEAVARSRRALARVTEARVGVLEARVGAREARLRAREAIARAKEARERARLARDSEDLARFIKAARARDGK